MKTQQSGKAWAWLIVLIIIAAVVYALTANSPEQLVDSEQVIQDQDAASDLPVEDPSNPPVPTDDEMAAGPMAFTATIVNQSQDQPLSPGVYVVHDDTASLNFMGSLAPDSLEPLAEVGSNADFAAFVANVPGVMQVITVDQPILPSESLDIMFEASEGMLLSGIQMAVGSNDGYTLVDSLAISNGASGVATNYDAGTEENTELGSGFDGGQPDPARGEENINNGIATDPKASVELHEQLTETILGISIASQ